MSEAAPAMPRYKSHKIVEALHLDAVVINHNGTAVLTPSDKNFPEIKVDAAYVKKHTPGPGGYFIVYPDGYQSFSPAKAFEDGYDRLEPDDSVAVGGTNDGDAGKTEQKDEPEKAEAAE